ncbi:unnamed protein product, partial [Ectocarpus sp. 8 AP-2014]
AFAARVASEVGVALACVRGRERRAAIRAQALKKLANVCLNGKPSGNEAKEAVLTEISKVLPGCRAYVGVLQSGGHALLYEAATPNSAMKGRELRRGEGIGLSCLDDPDGEIRDESHDVDEDIRASDHSSKAWPWPFVCAPLRSAGNRVGVLGVDGWSDVELGRPDEVHPEKAVVKFIHEAANLLAGALYTERRNRGLSAMGKTLRE